MAWGFKGRDVICRAGCSVENAYSESFHSRFRDELLHRELFTSLREAKVLAGDYRLQYNHRRPHSSLGYQIPAAWAARCSRTDESAGVLPPDPGFFPSGKHRRRRAGNLFTLVRLS